MLEGQEVTAAAGMGPLVGESRRPDSLVEERDVVDCAVPLGPLGGGLTDSLAEEDAASDGAVPLGPLHGVGHEDLLGETLAAVRCPWALLAASRRPHLTVILLSPYCTSSRSRSEPRLSSSLGTYATDVQKKKICILI